MSLKNISPLQVMESTPSRISNYVRNFFFEGSALSQPKRQKPFFPKHLQGKDDTRNSPEEGLQDTQEQGLKNDQQVVADALLVDAGGSSMVVAPSCSPPLFCSSASAPFSSPLHLVSIWVECSAGRSSFDGASCEVRAFFCSLAPRFHPGRVQRWALFP